MARHRALKSLLGGLCAVVILAACQSSETIGPENAHPWLDQVEVEASYLIANKEPLDDAAFDRWMGSLWPLVLQGLRAELDARWVSWLAQLDTSQGWRETGLNPNGYWIFYEDASTPTAKIPLNDTTRFWNTLMSLGLPQPMVIKGERDAPKELAQEIRIPLPDSFTIGRYEVAHPRSLSLHTQANWLTIRVTSTDGRSNERPSELSENVSQPVAKWSQESWETLLDEHTIVGPIGGLFRPSQALSSAHHNDLACQTQWAAWDQTAPHVIFGTQVLNGQTLALLVRYQATEYPLANLEIDPLISPNIALVLDAEVAGIGLAFDARSMQTQLLSVLNSGIAFTDECLDLTVETTNQSLPANLTSQPIPPAASSVRGLVSRLDEWQAHAPSAQPSVRFFTEIYLSNPLFLVGLAQMLSPELAGLNLMPNQPAQKVPDMLLEPFTSAPVYLSTTPNSIRASSHKLLTQPSAMDMGEDSPILQSAPLWAAGTVNFERLSELEASINDLAFLPPTDDAFSSINEWAEAMDLGQLSWRFGPAPSGIDTWLKLEGRSKPLPDHLIQELDK